MIYFAVISWGVAFIGAMALWAGKRKAGVLMVTIGSICFLPLGFITLFAARRVGGGDQGSLDKRRQRAGKPSPQINTVVQSFYGRKQSRLWIALWMLILLLASVPLMLRPEDYTELLNLNTLMMTMVCWPFPVGRIAWLLVSFPIDIVLQMLVSAFCSGVLILTVGCWYYISPVACFFAEDAAFTPTPISPTRRVLYDEIERVEQRKNSVIIYYRPYDLKVGKSSRKARLPFRYLLEDEDQAAFLKVLAKHAEITPSASQFSHA
ncbi:hypothetical protein [Terasakiispira papahanaumokuakeensis]|uniref:hypothetical protein n=1 Tax=Terasakiispira papahanaumokuakeensis TaxID=197479 RepID=UPI001586C3F7|nr:hypothetical protein [Terasakiispira papahanaumokuakeensis]